MGSNVDLTLMRAYRTNGTVFANVSLLASAAAGQEWRLYRTQKQDGRVRYTTATRAPTSGPRSCSSRAGVLNKPAMIQVGNDEAAGVDAVRAVRDQPHLDGDDRQVLLGGGPR